MKHYLVTGRMCGDDEDTAKSFQAESRDEAINYYVRDMWELELTSFCDPRERLNLRQQADGIGEGVFVNGVFVSDSPIEEAT